MFKETQFMYLIFGELSLIFYTFIYYFIYIFLPKFIYFAMRIFEEKSPGYSQLLNRSRMIGIT